ncbi:MAG: hypothetical protein NDJ75_09600 [Thermoanaerobaculia bacterium]|nr:hypothetical protein [Thermoanaerobaculia bacterium]
MKSWRDDDLILHLYGEHPRRDELARDLAADAGLARRFAALARDLAPFDALEASEPPADFEARTWAALRPRLAAEPRRGGWRALFAVPSAWRLAALAATLVAALGAAFWAGRQSAPPVAPDADERLAALPLSIAARERLLFASLAGHFESSGLLLTGLANAPADVTLAEERQWAATLLASNRLYRQAAERAGQRRVVALLDELEPLLLELVHRPESDPLADLQHRIAERDLLFKVRVVGGRLGTARAGATSSL